MNPNDIFWREFIEWFSQPTEDIECEVVSSVINEPQLIVEELELTD